MKKGEQAYSTAAITIYFRDWIATSIIRQISTRQIDQELRLQPLKSLVTMVPPVLIPKQNQYRLVYYS